MAKKYLDTKMFKDICNKELKQSKTVKYNCGDYEVEINVKPYSTLQEKQTIAETVWACYGGKNFHVAAHSPAYRLMVLYTYCDNLKIDLSKGISAYYDLVMHTGLFDAVSAAIDRSDMSELDDVVWNYVRDMEATESASDIGKSISSLLATVNAKLAGLDMDKLLGDIQKVAKAAEDGNIVEKVLEHYGQKEDVQPKLELVRPEDGAYGEHNSRSEKSNSGKD